VSSVNDSNTLHPTFSSWLENMTRLSSLIDQLSELAATAPKEHYPELIRQVDALRTDLSKQQERYAAFLRLTKKYAERFLSDISDEIQQQSSLLEALQKRVDMAKTLHKKVVHLREEYEIGTLKCIKKVRNTGACPRTICYLCDVV
jgi:DNA repair ATPase RecN